MPTQYPAINKFNAGIWSPKLRARNDLEDYDSALEVMDGFIPLKYGEAQAMTGFLHGAETKNNAKKSILIPFQYSSTDSYWIELGDLYMRIVNPADGTYVESGGSPVEVVTPFTEAQLYQIQYQELNDLVVLTHQAHHPQEINRITDTNWTIGDYEIDYPAFLTQNSDDTKKITPSALTGTGITLTATGHTPFTSDMVDGYIAITHLRPAQETSISAASGIVTPTSPSASWAPATLYSDKVFVINDGITYQALEGMTSEATFQEDLDLGRWAQQDYIKVKGKWKFYSAWKPGAQNSAIVELQRSSDGGLNWLTIRRRVVRDGAPLFDLDGEEAEDDILFRIIVVSSGYGDAAVDKVSLSIEEIPITGYAKITGFTSSTIVTADVIVDFEGLDAEWHWQIGGWNDEYGYPTACTVFEERVFFGGTPQKPTGVWASEQDGIDNFDFNSSADDTDPWFRVLSNSQEGIQWMARKSKIFIGTSGEEFQLSSTGDAEALTPTNATAKALSVNGSKNIKPIGVGDSVIFVTSNGIQVRELAFSADAGQFNGNFDLTELSDEITGNGVIQMTFQLNPNRIAYLVREDGVLLGLVFDKQNGLNGWFTRGTDGFVESVVSTKSQNINDPLGVVVRREINGVTKRFIEVLSTPSNTNSDWVYMDAAIEFPALGSTAVTGLSHLEGKTVKVMNDGALETDKVVTGGAITLDRISSINAVIGLDFNAEFITLPIQVNKGDGNSKHKQKRCSSIMLGVRESIAGMYGGVGVSDKGDSIQTEDSIFPGDTGEWIMGQALTAGTRFYELPMEGGNYREFSLRVRRTQPTPLNVTHAIPEMGSA